MALIKCHECSGEVSTQAASCPKCGAKVKLAAKPPSRSANALIAVLVISVVGLYGIFGDSDAERATKAAQAETACRANLQCWGDKKIQRADAYCKDSIERLAAHSVKWTNGGASERKFSRFRWLNQHDGSLTFIGDKAEFQNGFGAFTPVVYECDLADLDKESPRVLGARVLSEGRLPQ